MKKRIIAAVLGLLFAVSLISYLNLGIRANMANEINKIEGKTLNKSFNTKIKSGDLSVDYDIDTTLADIDRLKLNTVNVPVEIDIKALNSSDMNINQKSEEKAKELINKLNAKKINIILEAYPWIDNGSKLETDWKPDNINSFFNNWRDKVLFTLIKDIAVPYHVDAVNVASNFVNMENEQQKWCSIIDFVRKYYKGLVTYKTNWWYTAVWDKPSQERYQCKLNNKLFSKVDFISIAAYFELSENAEDTKENLTAALSKTQIYNREQNVKKEIQNFNSKWNKPIYFGELGFPDRDYAAKSPWNSNSSDIVNSREQANCFYAYKKVFTDNWFLGFSVFAIGKQGEDKHYYPQEESEDIIKNWFN